MFRAVGTLAVSEDIAATFVSIGRRVYLAIISVLCLVYLVRRDLCRMRGLWGGVFGARGV